MYYIALLLLFLLIKIDTASRLLFDHLVCEHDTLSVNCPKGYAINIISALYGRKDDKLCHPLKINDVNCAAQNALDRMKLLCDHKQNCRVHASNDVFLDPCYGTKKYLEVSYECRNVQEPMLHAMVCEHETLSVNCPKGYAINIVSALYGRKDHRYCHHPGINEVNCAAENALDKIKSLCNTKQNCRVHASNNEFGDPCYGTRKYLEVSYECIKVQGDILSSLACEGDELKINCGDGYYLRIVNALYGRNDPVTCFKEGKPILTNYCGATGSMDILKTRCNYLKECTVGANNVIFGDPCFGTYKYLEVDYQCLARY